MRLLVPILMLLGWVAGRSERIRPCNSRYMFIVNICASGSKYGSLRVNRLCRNNGFVLIDIHKYGSCFLRHMDIHCLWWVLELDSKKHQAQIIR